MEQGELVTQKASERRRPLERRASKANRSSSTMRKEAAISFISADFIPMLRECGAGRVLLTGPVPDLLELVADNVAVDGLVPLAGPFECDYVVGSMSVPWRCGATLEGVKRQALLPAQRRRRFRYAACSMSAWCWRGNAAYAKDVDRSMPLSALCPLFEIPDVAFYSLQVGEAAKEITTLGFDGFIGDLAPFAKSWRATAKLIKRLDASLQSIPRLRISPARSACRCSFWSPMPATGAGIATASARAGTTAPMSSGSTGMATGLSSW